MRIADIRTVGQSEAGHLPGAITVPITELPRRIDEIDRGDDTLVAWPTGQSSGLIESYEGRCSDGRVARRWVDTRRGSTHWNATRQTRDRDQKVRDGPARRSIGKSPLRPVGSLS